MTDIATLRVLLGDVEVGILSRNRNDGTQFRFLTSYRERYPRPVLGQAFLDDLDRNYQTRARVPAWFSNLLPEGPLRELVANQVGVHSSREFFLLARLGDDLPGAVRIMAKTTPDALDDDDGHEVLADAKGEPLDETDDWHFSLAGVQLKFSARRHDRGLTVPVSGRGGDWIVKLPDARFPGVPENEYATLSWARACGIAVPDIERVAVTDIDGLPDSLRHYPEPWALAIRRFDRGADGTRIHMEDFAQVLGLYPEDKYRRHNYETLANLIRALTGPADLAEFIRRLVFVVLSGNGDAHHKNWSLVYPDGVRAALSPAYDLVATVHYRFDDSLALNLAGSKRWQDVGLASFRRLAQRIGLDPDPLLEQVRAAVETIRGAWVAGSGEFGYDQATRASIERHFARLPLASLR